MTIEWQQSDPIKKAVSEIDSFFALSGESVTQDPISELKRIVYKDRFYYLKRYYQAGKHLRQYLGRSRARAECDGLKVFKSLSIPTVPLIAFGEKRTGLQRKSFLLTAALENVQSLLTLHQNQATILKNRSTRKKILGQVANYTRRLHQAGFVHFDLYWRNILVEIQTAKVYFIDCPQGCFPRWQRQRGIVKDLASLDKVGKKALSRTERLRFYLQHQNTKKLTDQHKQQIKKVLVFFEGRD